MAGPLPYLATGGGAGAPIVFLAGLSPEVGVASGAMQRVNLASIAPFARDRRVLFFNRREGLSDGMKMAELAGEQADAIRALGGAAVDVIGASTGGSIAQQLAADHPDVVRRLVLISTACRLAPSARLAQRRVAARIRRGAHRQALALLAAELVPPYRGKLAAAALAWLVGPRLFPSSGLADMARTIEAEDGFDLSSCANPVRAPTLILAGYEDRFYGVDLFTETARLIPNSRLRLFDGRGHLTVSADPELAVEVEHFLASTDA